MTRIAHIRTWTYITHRADWVDDAADWQERARGIEDRLSDALHDRITQRFVDRRSAFLVRHLAGDGELLASVDKDGEVQVEGSYVGRLDGFRFVPDATDDAESRMLATAANRVLRGEIAARGRQLATDPDEAFAIDAAGKLLWRGGQVGRLAAGERIADAAGRGAGRRFSRGPGARAGAPAPAAFRQGRDRAPPGAALFALRDLLLSGGRRAASRSSLSTRSAACRRPRPAISCACSTAPRAARWPAPGCGSASETIYLEPLLGAESARFRALLWAVRQGRAVPKLPGARALGKAIAVDPALPASFYAALGRRVVGGLAVRPDRLERLAAAARAAQGADSRAIAELAGLAGVAPADLRRVLVGLGYRALVAGRRRGFRRASAPLEATTTACAATT